MPLAQQDHRSQSNAADDPRPRFALGHLALTGADIDNLTDFYESIGMRLVVRLGSMSIIELRGGTHIIIRSGPVGDATLDFIVDDIDETRAVLEAAGAEPTTIRRGSPHDMFTATDPEGNTLVVNSNHAMGPV